jgi:hypothetical protein
MVDCMDEEHDFVVYKGRDNLIPAMEQPAMTLDEATKAVEPGATSIVPPTDLEPEATGVIKPAAREPSNPETT